MIARIIIGASLGVLCGVWLLATKPAPQAPMTAQAAPQATQAPIAGDDRAMWAYDLLTRLGNGQPSAETIAFVVEWTLAEDGSMGAFERNNPLNTTQEGFNETHTINGDGVRGYATRDDGLAATLHTLTNGFYNQVVAGLLANDPDRALQGLLASPWAESRYNGGVGWPHYEVQAQKPAQQVKCPVTDTMAASADFYATGSPYWAEQAGGMHQGIDYSGNPGDAVYAPFDLTVEDVGYYGDAGRIGYYVQGRFTDGVLFYAGHLGTVAVAVGQRVAVCDVLGTIGDVYHTHVKIAAPDMPIPCEAMGCLDFAEYWRER